jgi:hypothetical protein
MKVIKVKDWLKVRGLLEVENKTMTEDEALDAINDIDRQLEELRDWDRGEERGIEGELPFDDFSDLSRPLDRWIKVRDWLKYQKELLYEKQLAERFKQLRDNPIGFSSFTGLVNKSPAIGFSSMFQTYNDTKE